MIRATVQRFVELGLLLGLLAAVAFGIYVGVTKIGGGDGDGRGQDAQAKELGAIETTLSSWVDGQASLASYDEYGPLSKRALALAELFAEKRAELLAAIEKARLRASKAERRKALRAYRRAKRKAEREYKAALARAKAEQERLERKQARLERKRQRELERLREKHKVPPGKECEIPEVREQFDCKTGYPF